MSRNFGVLVYHVVAELLRHPSVAVFGVQSGASLSRTVRDEYPSKEYCRYGQVESGMAGVPSDLSGAARWFLLSDRQTLDDV